MSERLDTNAILRVTEKVQKEIIADVKEDTVPATVAGFSELHDYVDANCYGGLCDEPCPEPAFRFPEENDAGHYDEEPYDLMMAHVNAMQERVDQWLKAGGLVGALEEEGEEICEVCGHLLSCGDEPGTIYVDSNNPAIKVCSEACTDEVTEEVNRVVEMMDPPLA